MIVGDAAVGKSCILVRLTDDRFAATESTLGVEFGARVLSCQVGDESKRVKVQCEFAGFVTVAQLFRGSRGELGGCRFGQSWRASACSKYRKADCTSGLD